VIIIKANVNLIGVKHQSINQSPSVIRGIVVVMIVW